MIATRLTAVFAVGLFALAGSIAGGAFTAHDGTDDAVQVAYAAYHDYETLAAFKTDADIVIVGDVQDDGVAFRDFGLRSDPVDPLNDGIAMRMITVSARDGVAGQESLLRVVTTDVGLNGISSDAMLRNGDVVALMLERIDATQFDLRGISATEIFAVVGGRQGVFRPTPDGSWIQDEDPFEESANDEHATPPIRADLLDILGSVAND